MTQAALIKPSSSISKIWLVPLAALLMGLWMIYQQWQNQGPLITIELPSATGIEINQTPVKVRDLEVGQVKKISLKPNLDGVIVTARLDANAEPLLTENTKFWVVSPRISLSEVSGLNTLLSGSYIAMQASTEGKEKRSFVALNRPPSTPIGTPGVHIVLTSNDEFAFKPGDPIIYKGFKVGEFEDAQFDIEQRVVFYRAFVQAPYHKLITYNTRFWNVSGVRFRLESSGLVIETGSLETLLANGVSFGIPDGVPVGEMVENDATFAIYKDENDASDARFKMYTQYLLMFDESVRGLSVGSPVEYRGLEIGKVESINLAENVNGRMLEEDFPIKVVINVYPGKIQQQDTPEGLAVLEKTMHKWIGSDLRASLRMGSLITGGLYVDLQHVGGVSPTPVSRQYGMEVIPTISSEFTQLTQKADAILDKINSLPLARMAGQIESAVLKMEEAALSVEAASGDFDKLIANVDTKAINQNLNQTLLSLNQLIEKYAHGGMNPREIKETVDTLQTTLNSMQPLLLQLNQSPNRLFFPADSSDEPEPKAVTQDD